MSHPSRSFPPPFSFVVEEPYSFDGQVPQLSINTTQPWMSSSGPRSVQHQMPSPSASIRTVVTAPDPRSFNQSSFHQANRSPIGHNIDPNLPDNLSLLAPSGHVSRPSYSLIARHFQDQPWSAGNLRSSDTSGGRSPLNQPAVQYGSYRGVPSPGSDIDSNVLPSDSGYHSQPPQSVFSNEPGQRSQDVPSSIPFPDCNLNIESTPSEAPAMRRMTSDQISQISGRSEKSGKSLLCYECDVVSKCNSDLKKHMLKHKKPFKCDIPNCKRDGQGFTTINDLDRHKKSVHRIGLRTNKSYQCASPNCRSKEKIWPRLDNFKQHIERLHKDEDEDALIKRSVFRPLQRASIGESTTVAPMDTNLAVAGMEKSFSDNPAMNAVPALDLPLDQSARRWASLRRTPSDLAKDVCQLPSHSTGSAVGDTTAASQELQGPPSYISQRASGTMTRRESQILHANAELHIVSEQPALKTQGQTARPSLSNAPQTKAEQQRSTLEKASQAITGKSQSSSPSDPVNLEDLVLRILHKATNSALAERDAKSPQQTHNTQESQNCNTPVILTQREALKASQTISNMIGKWPGFTYTVPRRPTQGFISNAKVCPKCDYAVARDCDLRKHMKRHEKLYGCTYPKCHKRFGAKSDWKRHENSQHFQLEAFRCAEAVAGLHCSQATCGQHFFRARPFEDHLATQHKMLDPVQLKEKAKFCKIGKNCQGSFWCGFCGQVIELKQKRNAAWDERFDHIACHFEKGKKSIDEWICVEENKRKKHLSEEMDSNVLDDENETERVDVDVDGDFPPPAAPNAPEEVPMPRGQATPPPPPPPPQVFAEGNDRKRQASADSPGPQRRMKRRQATIIPNRYCCSCSSGPCGDWQASCADCEHQLCINCTFTNELWMEPIYQ
ncbi:uncharacterized protein K460DRAFT_407069 [Cucurbitaria berberidis CBS 394.84]|uniref:C2H2-type domain-containing protein n=1 Tax=Cucurbitaria berberidis CBS 394.84 TaxID=1168544 RepID=A0A9P4L5V9_9PLEO|nr:uncharacterized protein K460DRAFT_407069 [Cucurbitaria berberidis CBS 394.84]KAF1842674.1 hypothetical protein K460DRAFT_407069 [Cucurbitaria berberidis CBS 394.84]